MPCQLHKTKVLQRGRPRIVVNEEQLQYLIECRFRVKDIAALLGCTTRTIQRRMSEFGLSSNAYTATTDTELDRLVCEVTSAYPQCGAITVSGRLRSQGVRVPRQRIRDSLLRVDPTGVESRKRRVLHRRVYSVRSPNSLWHLDGYHKLIRWKIVIHGGIDGYSRLITFLRASTNNRASTVSSAFQMAVVSRIRTDRWRKCTSVAVYARASFKRYWTWKCNRRMQCPQPKNREVVEGFIHWVYFLLLLLLLS